MAPSAARAMNHEAMSSGDPEMAVAMMESASSAFPSESR